MSEPGKAPKIIHFLPGESLQWAPVIIRQFQSHHREMETDLDDHRFVVFGNLTEEQQEVYRQLGLSPGQLVFVRRGVVPLARFFWSLDRRCHVVFHSIFWFGIWIALLCRPRLWRRSVWLIWGGDVYCFRVAHDRWTTLGGAFRNLRRAVYRKLRKTIVRRFDVIGTLAPGDFELLEEYCGKLDGYQRLFYAEEYIVLPATPERAEQGDADTVRVCLGNSATASNCHLEVLKWLSRFRDEKIEVVCPLSYGDADYRDAVVEAGKSLLGDRFRPLVEFLDREKYKELLNSLDIAISNHNRQQGLFVIYVMASSGKKCFLRSDGASYALLRGFDIAVFPTEAIESMSFADFRRLLRPDEAEKNRRLCQEHLSTEASIRSWKQLFAHFRQSGDRIEITRSN